MAGTRFSTITAIMARRVGNTMKHCGQSPNRAKVASEVMNVAGTNSRIRSAM